MQLLCHVGFDFHVNFPFIIKSILFKTPSRRARGANILTRKTPLYDQISDRDESRICMVIKVILKLVDKSIRNERARP
jgi:hypothetical protein